MTQDEARQELRWQFRTDALKTFCAMFGVGLDTGIAWENGQREIPGDVCEMLAYLRQERTKGGER
jgi:hypothetical protein